MKTKALKIKFLPMVCLGTLFLGLCVGSSVAQDEPQHYPAGRTFAASHS